MTKYCLTHASRRTPVWRPPTDLYEIDDLIVVRVEVAGMKASDFRISLTGQRLQIGGTRPDIIEQRAYHQMEIGVGEFDITIGLPCKVYTDRVQAEYQEGFLKIIMPKLKPRKIPVHE